LHREQKITHSLTGIGIKHAVKYVTLSICIGYARVKQCARHDEVSILSRTSHLHWWSPHGKIEAKFLAPGAGPLGTQHGKSLNLQRPYTDVLSGPLGTQHGKSLIMQRPYTDVLSGPLGTQHGKSLIMHRPYIFSQVGR
jgi:hypothetical protein